jgi:SAM-dependent methyltransferase
MSTDKKTINWYNNNAQEYAEHVLDKNAVYHQYYEKPAMYAALPDLNGKDVVSIGCGSGEDISYLKKQGARRAVGVDISEKLIEIAKKNKPDCEFYVGDIEHLNKVLNGSGKQVFASESFDFAYSSLAIHYLKNWNEALKQIYTTLRPNSYFLFSCGHPVRMGMSLGKDGEDVTVTLQVRKNKTTKEVKTIGNYMKTQSLNDALKPNSVTTWHKPLGEMTKEIKESGFIIDEIIEPLPLEEMKNVKKHSYERLQVLPEFIIFKLYKK